MELDNIDFKTAELDGVHTWDYPDFCDAFIASMQTNDGRELNDKELDWVNDNCTGTIHELATESFF